MGFNNMEFVQCSLCTKISTQEDYQVVQNHDPILHKNQDFLPHTIEKSELLSKIYRVPFGNQRFCAE